MHTYSIDRELRTKVAILIFMISMVFSLLAKYLCSGWLEQITIYLETSEWKQIVNLIEWFEVNPNILGIPFWYGILMCFYEKIVWKWPLLYKLHNIPNLNGIWSGTLTSSYNGKTIPMKMEIKQTWSKISFHSVFTNTNSESYSNVAAIYVEGNNGIEISFAFKNDNYSVPDKMQSYDGYNILKLVHENTIKARYFNNRENPNPNFKGGNKGVFEIVRKK